MKPYAEFCCCIKSYFTMEKSNRLKTSCAKQLLSCLYLIAAFILNLVFPNWIITYAILGMAIIVGVTQLKTSKL